jgi:hypothetical protein
VRPRLAAAAIAALLAAAAAGPAQASTAIGAVQAKQQAAPAAQQPSHDDAEQRGHVIADEPQRQDPAPAPTPAPPSAPPVSPSPVRTVEPAPVAAPQRPELPQTGWGDGATLAFFGLMLAGAGRCLRRVAA